MVGDNFFFLSMMRLMPHIKNCPNIYLGRFFGKIRQYIGCKKILPKTKGLSGDGKYDV
jgi:hypothetical protein